MLSDAISDKAPVDLVLPHNSAIAAVHGGIYDLRESGLEFDPNRDVPVDVEAVRNAVAGWESIVGRAANACGKLARDLEEFGHYFAGVNSGAVSITVPVGGLFNGGPMECDEFAEVDFDCKWNRIGTAPSWHHVAFGVGRLFLTEMQMLLWRFEDVLREHTARDGPPTDHAVVYMYHDTVGNKRRLPITLGWGESELALLALQLDQELQRAWATWFPAGSEFTAYGDWPEEEREKAKSIRRGRKKADYEIVRREATLAAEWGRARDAGTPKVNFAHDNGMKLADFDRLLKRVASRKKPVQ